MNSTDAAVGAERRRAAGGADELVDDRVAVGVDDGVAQRDAHREIDVRRHRPGSAGLACGARLARKP